MCELWLTVEKIGDHYRWRLGHQDAVMTCEGGVAPSVAGAIRDAFAGLAPGERVYAALTLPACRDGEEEYFEGDPPRRSGYGFLEKGPGQPDFEKAARFLLARLPARRA